MTTPADHGARAAMNDVNEARDAKPAEQFSIHKSRSPYFADGWYAELSLVSGDSETIGPYQSREIAARAAVARCRR